MHVKKISGDDERAILIGMIVHPVVISRIADKWKGRGLFQTRWANIVGKWAVDYCKKYSDAPGKSIQGLFDNWAKGQKDHETVELISSFLSSLDGEYDARKEELNPEYVIDQAGRHFNKVKIEGLIDNLQAHIDADKVEDAQESLNEYAKVELGGGAGIDVMTDQAAIQEAFAERLENLIEYPGDLGKFFQGNLTRDSFVAFMGPEKRGKSFWLMDVAFRAMQQRRRVAYFQVGDMSQNQVMRRLMTRAARRPLHPKTLMIPTKITKIKGIAVAEVERKKIVYDRPLSWQAAYKACGEIQGGLRSTESYLRLSVHPNTSISVRGIHSIIKGWEREGWTPDVIVIDYADILDMPEGGDELRNKTNETWKRLRSLSQEMHCLVVTATQTNVASYRAGIMDRTNFSEDKRKLAHVTGMVGINQTREERAEDILRLNWIVLREDEFTETKCAYCAACLALANPAVRSTIGRFDENEMPREDA